VVARFMGDPSQRFLLACLIYLLGLFASSRLPLSLQDILLVVMPNDQNHDPHNQEQGEGYQRKESESEKHAVHIVSQHIDNCAHHEHQVHNH
jgi:hypothetical protein